MESNDNPSKMIKNICSKSYSHICLLGDFNYKDIIWKSWSTSHGETSEEMKFIETVCDSFLFQCIEEPTNIRGIDVPSLLDLLLTNEEFQGSDIAHYAPVGKSDH